MVLLLAVEPDARQATNLARVLRARPRTELVIAESAARALQTLAGRVPDVLLTSALISRQDEVTLAAWLKDLGPAAAHVQELTIPLLATSAPPPPKKRRGVMATLRRERTTAATPDGCDPDVFAEQVSGYMDRASAGRAPAPEPIEIAPPEIEIAPIPVAIAPTIVSTIAPTDESEFAPTIEEEIAPTVVSAIAPSTEEEISVELLLLPPTVAEVGAGFSRPTIETTLDPDTEDLLPLVCAVQFAPEPLVELLLLRPVAEVGAGFSRPAIAELEPMWAQDTEDLLPLVCAYEPQVQPAEALALAEAAVEEAEDWVPILIEDELDDAPQIVPEDVWVLGPVSGIDELLEICVPASAIVAAPPSPCPLPPAEAQPKAKAASAKKKSVKQKAKPVQDEWGFFDPDQCGFAALLAKLDEITEQNDAHEDAQSEDTTVRLLSY